MLRKTTCLSTLVLLIVAVGTEAAIVTYDASSGLPPQSVGWTFSDENNPPSTVTVNGGVLTHDSALSNRAFWEMDLDAVNGTLGDSGAFMESTARIRSESGGPDRAVGLATVGAANGTTGSSVRLQGKEDRVFLTDNVTDTVIVSVPMDTTDTFHTYRLELWQDQAWLFVDGSLAVSVTTTVIPFAGHDLGGVFGDGSAFSESVTHYKTINIGSLADIGGPTIPEPSTLTLATLTLVGLLAHGHRRRRA